MLIANLNQLDQALLQKLCDDGCPESDTLDFKRELPGTADKDRVELQKDVCGLANSNGGDLIYGIGEAKGGNAESLFPIVSESADAALRRISQVLDAIEPRIHNIRIQPVMVGDGFVLVVRVPASFDGPHSFRVNTARRFTMRNSTTTTDMSFDQIRAAFDRTASLAEKAQRFIEHRVQLIACQRGARKLVERPLWTVHLIPISGLAGKQSVNIQTLYERDYLECMRPDMVNLTRRLTLDGLTISPAGPGGVAQHAYSHVFRTGAIESVYVAGHVGPMAHSEVERGMVSGIAMTEFFMDTVDRLVNAANRWGLSGPAIIQIGLLNVGTYALITRSTDHYSKGVGDRQNFIVPETWVESLETIDVVRLVAPMLDTLWQAFGEVRCPHFDEETGAFVGAT